MQQRILYVEDEPVLGQLVSEALVKQGFEVQWTRNGGDALQQFRSYRPQLCLLDIMLPGADGYEIARQIRAADKTLPLIFLTAKTQVTDLVQGFSAGCNDYVRKPFNMEELLLRVDNWLRVCYGGHEQQAPGSIAISRFLFDPLRQLLTGKDQTIRLSHKEAELLKLLCAHRNTIISREYVLQQVWGSGSVYNSRILDVYITRLRKYFKPDKRIDIITLRGIGYRFIC